MDFELNDEQQMFQRIVRDLGWGCSACRCRRSTAEPG
jgi:hypothetical protein